MTTFPDRPGYERTSSTLWKQREEYCAILIQQAWRDHHKSTVIKGANARNVVTRGETKVKIEEQPSQPNGNQVIEVKPSPSHTNKKSESEKS